MNSLGEVLDLLYQILNLGAIIETGVIIQDAIMYDLLFYLKRIGHFLAKRFFLVATLTGFHYFIND